MAKRKRNPRVGRLEYGFVLEWDELDDELRERKVEEMMAYDIENGNVDESEQDYTPMKHAQKVEESIVDHFPMYF
mgnify:CR=1 FL=1